MESITFPQYLTGGPTVADLGERETINAITRQARSQGNGDDAAVLALSSTNSRVVVTTDMLVAGRHFNLNWSTPEEVGQKAIVQNFADVEAMGARPIAALLSMSLPGKTPISFVTKLATGMAERLTEYTAELVGGDLTAGDCLVISVTAIGSLGGSLPALKLSAARSGQKVVATGEIGYSAAGLALLERYPRSDIPGELAPLVTAHCTPWIQPGRGVIARAVGATAMTDNSDGLIVDLGQIAQKSKLDINLWSTAIQPDLLLVQAGQLLSIDPWHWVLSGGEDHTLMATTFSETPSGFRVIGEVGKAKNGGSVSVDKQAPKYATGWESF